MKNFLSRLNFKEESWILPLSLIGFFILNWVLQIFFPNSALFDPISQFETLYYAFPSFVWILIVVWFVLWATFPAVFKHLRGEFYNDFEKLNSLWRTIISVGIFLAFFLGMCIHSKGAEVNINEIRAQVVKNVNSQMYIREWMGPNDSPEIRVMLRTVGIKQPAYWCGAFVAYNLNLVHVKNPMSAWSPDYARKQDIIWTPKDQRIKPLPADVFTIYSSHYGRVCHTGFYLLTDKSGYFINGEGNSSDKGSSNGDGVHKVKRDPLKIHAIARFIK